MIICIHVNNNRFIAFDLSVISHLWFHFRLVCTSCECLQSNHNYFSTVAGAAAAVMRSLRCAHFFFIQNFTSIVAPTHRSNYSTRQYCWPLSILKSLAINPATPSIALHRVIKVNYCLLWCDNRWYYISYSSVNDENQMAHVQRGDKLIWKSAMFIELSSPKIAVQTK